MKDTFMAAAVGSDSAWATYAAGEFVPARHLILRGPLMDRLGGPLLP